MKYLTIQIGRHSFCGGVLAQFNDYNSAINHLLTLKDQDHEIEISEKKASSLELKEQFERINQAAEEIKSITEGL